MRKITVANARYRTPALPEHQRNPLISAMPDLINPARLRQVLTRVPVVPELDGMDNKNRMILAKRIRNILVPTNIFRDFYHALYHLIIVGYESRNPLDPQVVEWHYDVADPTISLETLVDEDRLNQSDVDTTCEHLFLTGLSGVGKSAIKNSILATCFPDVIIHNREDFDEIQIVQLHCEMPHDGSRGTLLKNLMEGFDNALRSVEKTNFLEQVQPSLARSATIGAMESFLKSLCVKYHVGVIIVDEFQNINVASAPDKNKMRQLFDNMSNMLNVPFVKIGTTDSLSLFQSKFRHGRRAGETLEVSPYIRIPQKVESDGKLPTKANNKGRDWDNLVHALFPFQVTKKPIEFTERWDAELYRLSCGIPYVLFTLWQEAQIDAIRSGSETLTIKRLNYVFQHRFKLIKTALNALRKRKMGQFQDLLTINQLFDKNEADAAIKQLSIFVEKENFSGPAATEILDGVEVLTEDFTLNPTQKSRLAAVKAKLEQRAQPVLKGQTIEHKG